MTNDIARSSETLIEKVIDDLFRRNIKVSPDKPKGTDYLEEVLELLPKEISQYLNAEWEPREMNIPYDPSGIIERVKEMINDPFLFVMVKANGATIRGFQNFCEQVKIVRNDYIQSFVENLFAWLPTEEGKSFLTKQLSKFSITDCWMAKTGD